MSCLWPEGCRRTRRAGARAGCGWPRGDGSLAQRGQPCAAPGHGAELVAAAGTGARGLRRAGAALQALPPTAGAAAGAEPGPGRDEPGGAAAAARAGPAPSGRKGPSALVRAFRTGDLGCVAGGVLVLHGRADLQVQVKGAALSKRSPDLRSHGVREARSVGATCRSR